MSMLRGMDVITTLQASVCRTLAHPVRIAIIHLLANGPHEVGRIARELSISQPNASQHLAVMRTVGLVEALRDGREVSYRLTDPEIVVACQIMASVLRRHHQRYVEALEPADPKRTGPIADEPALVGGVS
jgi:DNA-binding transcriptional ArsR family regulator